MINRYIRIRNLLFLKTLFLYTRREISESKRLTATTQEAIEKFLCYLLYPWIVPILLVFVMKTGSLSNTKKMKH